MISTDTSTATGCASLAAALLGDAPLAGSEMHVVNQVPMHYLEAGGRLVIESTQHGKKAMCHRPSGEECDERAFFHDQALIGRSP
jgi:putative hemolysin